MMSKPEPTETTEPAVSLYARTSIAQSSIAAAVDRAARNLGTEKDGGRVRLIGVKDAGVVGAQVELTFVRETEHGRLAVGGFAEYTVRGDRRAGGVVDWSWGS